MGVRYGLLPKLIEKGDVGSLERVQQMVDPEVRQVLLEEGFPSPTTV